MEPFAVLRMSSYPVSAKLGPYVAQKKLVKTPRARDLEYLGSCNYEPFSADLLVKRRSHTAKG
jgi:hypothetical protein